MLSENTIQKKYIPAKTYCFDKIMFVTKLKMTVKKS